MSEDKSVVEYTSDNGAAIKLGKSIIRNYLVSGRGNPTDQEIMQFLMLCKNQRLDPFLREAYLIKYGTEGATMVVGKEVFTKRAERDPDFRGYSAGIIVTRDVESDKEDRLVPRRGAEIQEREGSLALPGELILGGWARVYKKDREVPYYDAVSFEEYAGRTKEGQLNRQWARMPATMIRKVALMHALREAFPQQLGGLYDATEMSHVNLDDLDEKPVKQEPKDVTPEPPPTEGEPAQPQDSEAKGKAELQSKIAEMAGEHEEPEQDDLF